MKAVIMAGGVGSRLRPLTCRISKPMVPVMGRPVMEYTLMHLKRHGIGDVSVTLQYLPETVAGYFGDGSALGMSIRYSYEDRPLGTAGSVCKAAEGFTDTFVVMSGDGLTDIDIGAAIAYHREREALATMVLKPMDSPMEFGTVMLGEDGRVGRFVEKPTRAQVFSDTVNTGIYVLEPEALEFIRKDAREDFANDVFPRILEAGKPLIGFVSGDYWLDIGSAGAYLRAHRDVMDGAVRAKTAWDKAPNGVFVAEDAAVDEGAVLEAPCYIGAGCVIGEGAKIGAYSVIGPGCATSGGADIKRSVLWSGARARTRRRCAARSSATGASY